MALRLVAVASLAVLLRAAVFNPLNYGAAGDGKTDDTVAVRATFAAAAASSTSTVLIPAGESCAITTRRVELHSTLASDPRFPFHAAV